MSKSNMNLKLVTGLLMASGTTVAFASMNNLNVQSNLGEQFSGSIVVTGPTAQEILKSPSSISVSGAPVSARVSKQGEAAVIHLRSSVPINDPVLRLRVQAGSESRQYSAIIDPKNSAHQSAQVNSAKAIPHPPALASNNQPASKPTATPVHKAAAPKPAQQTIQNNRAHTPAAAAPSNIAIAQQYKVQAKDNIFEIARRHQPEGLSTAQTVQALMRANPQAFRNHNPNLLYGDATLKIPSADAMHQLVKGRSAKTVVAVATTATAAVASTNTSTTATDDVAVIEKQLADLEQQKAQLEKQLVQAQQASAAAENTAEPVATASAPVVAASTPVVAPASTPVAAPTKAAPPALIPPVPEEKGLMDLLMENLPYLAGGLVVLLLLAMLIARSRKKAAATDEAAFEGSNDDDAVEIFNFDDASLEKVSLSKTDDVQNQLTDAELEALNSFNPQEETAFHQTTAKPTEAPQASGLTTGATALVGGAAVVAAAHAASEQDFMPSDEELAQYAQPTATAAPASDDFNLDDLDSLLKQGEVESQLISGETTSHDDFNFDFDVNELAQNNSLNLSSPALDFPDVDAVVEAPVATHLPQVEDVNFGDFDAELSATTAPSPEFNLDLGTVALGAAGLAAATQLMQDEPSTANEGLTLSQDDINAINFDDFTTPSSSTDTVVALDNNADIDALFQGEESTSESPAVSKFNSIPMDSGHELTFDDSFNLNFDDLLSVDEPASAAENSMNVAEATPAYVPEEISFDNVLASPTIEETSTVVNSAIAEDNRPAQAWAGTGNFGNPLEEAAAEAINTTHDAASQATEFDLDFNLDAAAPAASTAPEVVEETFFNTDDIMSFDLDVPSVDAPSAQETIQTASVDDAASDLSFDLDALNLDTISTDTTTAVADQAATDVSFDLDALSLDTISADTSTAVADQAATDVSFDLDALNLDTISTEASTAAADLSSADVNFDLDALSLDAVSTDSVSTVSNETVADMSFDLDALSLDTAAAEPAIQPAPTATPDSSNNFDFSLDDLNADVASAPAMVEATLAPSTDFSLDDFNLDEFATLETTEVTANPEVAIADVDFNLDSLSLDTAAEAAPVAAFGALAKETAPAVEEEDTPAAIETETADNLALQTLQHTQDAKLDLAKMYLEIGDKDAAMNILADLMENGSNDAAERAQALYQAL